MNDLSARIDAAQRWSEIEASLAPILFWGVVAIVALLMATLTWVRWGDKG